MTSGSRTPIVALEQITKQYGYTTALGGVDLEVHPGEVVGLIGDNGAGKSTIVKIIMGYTQPTSGQVRLNGVEVQFDSPRAAREAGIEAVYQDLALIDELSLWRNFFLGREVVRRVGPLRVLDRRLMQRTCAAALDRLGLVHVRSTEEPAAHLSGGERQSLAITRAVHFGARLLILDEPTAALSVRETANVLRTIADARSRGLGVLYIDHNMDHVQPVADRIVVVEHGLIAVTIKRGEATSHELRELLTRRTSIQR